MDFESKISYEKIDFLSRIPFVKSDFTIASYGFCLPGKGFPELIQAIKLLRDKNVGIKLNLFSAKYSNDYDFFVAELSELIKNLELEKCITLNTEYMTDDQSLNALSSHDLIVYPYQYSNESSSAAVRHGLATLRPVMVTPLPIFNDVSSCIQYFPGIEPKDLAEGLLDWFIGESKIKKRYFTNLPQIESFVNEFRFKKLSNRLFDMISSIELNAD